MPFNADEAIVALMARHILQGARPVFFYGQAYMGSLDAWLVAGFFRLIGEQVAAIRLVQTLLYLGFLLATAWVGRLAFGSWWSGALAALLLAIPTVNITLYTTASLGGYGEALLIGSLLLAVSLLLVSRLAEGRRSLGLWLAFGFLSGLGLWAFGLTAVFSLPAGVYLLWGLAKMPAERGKKLRIAVAGILLAALGFLLGASPWLGYAAQNGLGKLTGELSGGAIAGVEGLPWILQIYQHTLNLLLLGTTVAFGVRPPWSAGWLVLPLVPFLLVLWLAVSVYAVWSVNQPSPTRPARLLLLGVMGTLFLAFIFTPFGADPSGRYFVALAAPLALFGADLVLHLRVRYGRVAYGLVVAGAGLQPVRHCSSRPAHPSRADHPVLQPEPNRPQLRRGVDRLPAPAGRDPRLQQLLGSLSPGIPLLRRAALRASPALPHRPALYDARRPLSPLRRAGRGCRPGGVHYHEYTCPG